MALQINLKGLDGIQGPVYVGTGCVFKRQALYGYDPPPKDASKKDHSSGICPSWCYGSRKSGRKSENHRRGGKTRAPSRTGSATTPIFSLEDIEEGIEVRICPSQIVHFVHLAGPSVLLSNPYVIDIECG